MVPALLQLLDIQGCIVTTNAKELRNNYCFRIALVLISFEVQKWSVNFCALHKDRPNNYCSTFRVG